MLQVTFAELTQVLENAGSVVPAAEAHGCLCGALCASADYAIGRWTDELVPENQRPLPAMDEQAVRLLFTDTVRALRGDAMEFEPLLPDDDRPLELRAGALSQWCQGFLYGIATGEPIRLNETAPAVQEILADFTHISRAQADAGDAGEDEEEAYAEVFEYVRVGVQLIHDELAELRDTVTTSTMPSETEPYEE